MGLATLSTTLYHYHKSTTANDSNSYLKAATRHSAIVDPMGPKHVMWADLRLRRRRPRFIFLDNHSEITVDSVMPHW
jgi:hypothetical protein